VGSIIVHTGKKKELDGKEGRTEKRIKQKKKKKNGRTTEKIKK